MEWVALAYGLYALLRVIFRWKIGNITVLPAQHFPIVAVVLAVRLGREYFDLPWRDEAQGRTHRKMAWAFGLAAVIGAAVSFQGDIFQEHGFAWVMMVVLNVWIWVGGAAGAAALLWFAMGIRQKTEVPLVIVLKDRVGVWVRDWLPLLFLLYAYGVTEAVGPFVRDLDPELARIDRWMFAGRDPVELCEHIAHPVLSEWLAGSYVFYALLFPIVLGALYVLRDPKPFQETCFALCFTLAVGYVLYNIVPAKGPLFTQKYATELDLYFTGYVKEQLMDATRVTRDCFPSLHTGAGLCLLVGALRHVRRLGIAIAPMSISIPFACVYLRYHYAIDVLAGIALCAIAWVVTFRVTSSKAKAA